MTRTRHEVGRLASVVRGRRRRAWAAAHVPYYRETWADRSGADRTGPAAEDLADHAFRLAPLSGPWRPDLPEPGPDLQVLRHLLLAAGVVPRGLRPRSRVLVAECTTSADELSRFPAGRGLTYLAVPASPPAVRADALGRLVAAAHAVVIGRPGQLAALGTGVPVTVTRRWQEVPRFDASAAAEDAATALLHDPILGDVAVRRADCGQWHVPASAWLVRSGPAGPLLTRTRRRSPVLVDVASEALRWARPGVCSRHGGAVLRP